MKSFMTQKDDLQLRLEQFPGLQVYASAKGGAAARTLRNLRCRPDGTLCAREGTRTLVTLPETLRGAVWDETSSVIYAAAGAHIYAAFREENGSYSWEQIGQMQSSEGAVDFFSLDEGCVMMDGHTMYTLTPTWAEPITPYIPLYGKGWTGVDSKDVYEPRSLLTDQVHIQYLQTQDTYTIRLSVKPEHVDAVYCDGMLQDPVDYTHYEGTGDISFRSALSVGSVYDILVTLPPEPEMQRIREDFFRCRCVVRPGEVGRTMLLFGGGPGRGALYLSAALSREQRECCYAVAPHAVMLYLLSDGCMELGDGAQEIHGLVRHYDRTLIMTSKGSWMTDMQRLRGTEGKEAFLAVNSTLGCTSYGGARLVGNSPISICGSDILLWNADTDELDECNAQSMTQMVRSLLPATLGTQGRMYYDAKRDEMIFYLPGTEGACLVWQRALQCWTSYDYAPAAVQGLFPMGEDTGILLGNAVCMIEDGLTCDVDASGVQRAIACCFASHDLDFAHRGTSMRPYAVLVCADAAAGQEVTLSLRAAGGKMATAVLHATEDTPCEMQKRVSVGRCRHARLEIQAQCLGAFSLRMICIAAGN